jgi:hypothetical protein
MENIMAMRLKESLSCAARPLSFVLVLGLLCLPVAPAVLMRGASAQDAGVEPLPPEDGIVPQQRQKLTAGTKLRGKCEVPAQMPKNDDIQPGVKYHFDSAESEFFRLDRDGKPGDRVGTAKASFHKREEILGDTPKCHTLAGGGNPVVPKPGRYRMRVTRTVYDTTYYNVSGWSTPTNKTETTEDVDFEIVSGCDAPGDEADNAGCKLSGAAMRDAFAQAFDSRGVDTPPCYVASQAKDPNLTTYQVRLGKDYNLLPTADWVKRQIDEGHITAPQEGSRFMLQGAAQKVGDTYRVTIRIVNIETGVVVTAAKGDGTGCPGGLANAVDNALNNMNAPLRSYAPR